MQPILVTEIQRQLKLVTDNSTLRKGQKASTEEIIAAYRETGSVWKAAKRLGMAGQSVHERLRAMNFPIRGRRWSAEEDTELRMLIGQGLALGKVARQLGRPYGGVATRASQLEIRSKQHRDRKLPRGAGYDQQSIRKHFTALERYSGTLTQYARANSLNLDSLVMALERADIERWRAYVRSHATIPEARCEYCESTYFPNSSRQRFCSRRCQTDARADKAYFGGKRREAIGLGARVCQLCGRQDVARLAVHHMLGKENDPENEVLIALCNGCHHLVGLLGARKFVDDPVAWESLIHLAWMRRHGGQLPDDHNVVHVTVEIETYRDELNDLVA